MDGTGVAGGEGWGWWEARGGWDGIAGVPARREKRGAFSLQHPRGIRQRVWNRKDRTHPTPPILSHHTLPRLTLPHPIPSHPDHPPNPTHPDQSYPPRVVWRSEVARRGVVWCSMVWCGVGVGCGVAWYGVVWGAAGRD